MSRLYIKLFTNVISDARLFEAGTDGFSMWVRGLLYAKEHMTDGEVPRSVVGIFGIKQPLKTAAKLVKLGLWEVTSDGWTVGSDKWSRYQTTRDEVEHKRSEWRETKARQRSMSKPNVQRGHSGGQSLDSEQCPPPCPTNVQPPENREQRTEEQSNKEKLFPPTPPFVGEMFEASPTAKKPKRTIAEVEPSAEALEIATRWAKLVSQNLGPSFQQPTIRKFAVSVFGPMLSEFGRGSIETVFAYLATPRATEDWQYGLLNAPKGYEHPIKRNFGGLLGKAQRSGFTPKSNEPAKPLRLAPLRHLEPSPEPEPMGDGTEVEEC